VAVAEPVHGTIEWYRMKVALLDAAATRLEKDASLLEENLSEQGIVSKEWVTDNHGKRMEKTVPNPAARLWQDATAKARAMRKEIIRHEAALRKLEAKVNKGADPMEAIFNRLHPNAAPSGEQS
jgi:hypothetical protein